MSTSISRRRFVLTIPALAVLAACGDGGASEFGIPSSQPLSLSAIESSATGFDTGLRFSARRVYVFVDPQCPHCARFWQEAKKLNQMARFTWIPIKLMNQASMAQGATILAATNPAEAMEEHETAFRSAGYRGGISAKDVPAPFKAAVTKNTRLFESFKLGGVPLIVASNGRTGALYSRQGGLPAEQLAHTLGW